MNVFIYVLKDPRTNKVRYVGKTKNPKERFYNHLNKSRDKNTHKRNWINSLRALNLKPIFEVIEQVELQNWKEKEKHWIVYYKNTGSDLVNYTNGGEGLDFGNQTSFKKGSTPWNKGTAKQKVKIGFNKKCLETTFKPGSIPWNKNKFGYCTYKKGTKMSEEIKEKISKALTGRPSMKKRKIKQYDLNLVFLNEYESITEAKKITGIKGIGNVICGLAKTAGGFIWQ